MRRSTFFLIIFFISSARASLLEEISSKTQLVKNLSRQSCEAQLFPLQKYLEAIDISLYGNDLLKAEASELRNKYWQLRVSLHGNLSEMTPACALITREIFHTLRDLDDYLSEFSDHVPALQSTGMDFQKEAVPIYDVKAYPGTKSTSESFEFHDGDLMLARGFSFFSAMISQISDNVDHFSHTIVVSRKGSQVRTTESYVGDGVKNYEIHYALKNENVRLIVLRPKDQALATLAADAALGAGNRRLLYDYQMNFDDDSQMSCVEVPSYSYKTASRGQVKIPMYPAHLDLRNAEFLNRIGLKNGQLITPDDLEIDPRFDLILDWQDARLIRDERQKDAVVHEILRWLNDLHYKFYDSPKSYVAMYVLLPLRQTPFWNFLKDHLTLPSIDAHIPRTTLGLMASLDQTGKLIQEELRKQDEAYVKAHGRPMLNVQLRKNLEVMRANDLEKYQKGEESLFHKHLHP